MCKHWQSMHKLAIPVFALGRPSVSACSLSDFFSLVLAFIVLNVHSDSEVGGRINVSSLVLYVCIG